MKQANARVTEAGAETQSVKKLDKSWKMSNANDVCKQDYTNKKQKHVKKKQTNAYNIRNTHNNMCKENVA